MPDRLHPRRAALLLSAACAAGALAIGPAAALGARSQDGTGTTTIGGTPTPHLGVTWTILERRCHTVTKRERVHVNHHVRVEKKRVRECAEKAVHTRSHIHLGWRQHGEAYVHLTLAGKPIAGATVTETSQVAHHSPSVSTHTTDAHGRLHVAYGGPDRTITFSYTAAAGAKPQTRTGHVSARAHLSLFIGTLRAGHRGRFNGVVFGGHIPQGLYVQFYYLSASAGWQPFASLASVARHSGHWRVNIKIPANAAGYKYKIRATVVPSRYWPFAATTSRTLTRIVR